MSICVCRCLWCDQLMIVIKWSQILDRVRQCPPASRAGCLWNGETLDEGSPRRESRAGGGGDVQSAQRGEPTPQCSPEQLSVDRANMQLPQSYLLQLPLCSRLRCCAGWCCRHKMKQTTYQFDLFGSSPIFWQIVPRSTEAPSGIVHMDLGILQSKHSRSVYPFRRVFGTNAWKKFLP